MAATCEKRSPFWKVVSLLMALVMVFSIAAVPAAAAKSVNKTVVRAYSWNQLTKIKVTTGKGLFYSLGIKKTTLTLKNTGHTTVALYEETAVGPIWKGNLGGGQTRQFTLKGSAKNVVITCQLVNSSHKVPISASVNAGSIA